MADENNPNEGGQQGNEEGNQNQSGEGSQGASEFDASKMTADDFAKLLDRDDIQATLMKSESVRRAIQSEKDKELARESRKRLEDDRTAAEAESKRLDVEEKRQLIADGDADALLKREKSLLDQEKTDSASATRIDKIIERTLRTNPEYESLGEERINEIYTETIRTQGNVVDFSTALSKEKTKQAVEFAEAKVAKGLDEKISEAVELRMVEAGLVKRSEDAEKGNAPSSGITNDTANRANIKLDSKTDISLAYGNGEISTKEFTKRMEQFITD